MESVLIPRSSTLVVSGMSHSRLQTLRVRNWLMVGAQPKKHGSKQVNKPDFSGNWDIDRSGPRALHIGELIMLRSQQIRRSRLELE